MALHEAMVLEMRCESCCLVTDQTMAKQPQKASLRDQYVDGDMCLIVSAEMRAALAVGAANAALNKQCTVQAVVSIGWEVHLFSIQSPVSYTRQLGMRTFERRWVASCAWRSSVVLCADGVECKTPIE